MSSNVTSIWQVPFKILSSFQTAIFAFVVCGIVLILPNAVWNRIGVDEFPSLWLQIAFAIFIVSVASICVHAATAVIGFIRFRFANHSLKRRLANEMGSLSRKELAVIMYAAARGERVVMLPYMGQVAAGLRQRGIIYGPASETGTNAVFCFGLRDIVIPIAEQYFAEMSEADREDLESTIEDYVEYREKPFFRFQYW